MIKIYTPPPPSIYAGGDKNGRWYSLLAPLSLRSKYPSKANLGIPDLTTSLHFMSSKWTSRQRKPMAMNMKLKKWVEAVLRCVPTRQMERVLLLVMAGKPFNQHHEKCVEE